MSEYQALSHQIGNLNNALRDLVGEFSGFRGEIKAGFDGMDRRVQNLETDMRRLVSDQVAQDVITPKVFSDIDAFKADCVGRHERLDVAINTLRGADAEAEKQRAHGDGVAAGKKHSYGAMGSALLLLAAAFAWAYEHFFPKWFAGGAPK